VASWLGVVRWGYASGLARGWLPRRCRRSRTAPSCIATLRIAAAWAAALCRVAVEDGGVRVLRVRLFRHLQTLPLGFYQRTKGGQLLARIISDTDQVTTAVTAALASFLRNRSEEHTSELQSRFELVCRPLHDKKNRSSA